MTSGAMNCMVPANVLVCGLIPANRFEVPKSVNLQQPLYVLTRTLSPKKRKQNKYLFDVGYCLLRVAIISFKLMFI